jgi:hypothetical protein
MDSAVSLVRTYLQLHGYFVVTEYPVVEAVERGGAGGTRALTDLDVLAVRFPGAGRLVARGGSGGRDRMIGSVDKQLGTQNDQVDMIIGEVKQGEAKLNRGAHDPEVMRAALARFGACHHGEAQAVVEGLLKRGQAKAPCGHLVRLMVFASYVERSPGRGVQVMTLGHIRSFVQRYIRQHWGTLKGAQFSDPAMAFLMMLEKASRKGGPKR